MSFEKIKFNVKEYSAFIIFLFASILSAVIFIYLRNQPILKFIFLGFTVLLSIMWFSELLNKLEKIRFKTEMSDVSFLRSILLAQNLRFILWIIGTLAILYSLALSVFYNEFLTNIALAEIMNPISYVFLSIGFLLFLAGLFGRAQEEFTDFKFLKSLIYIGIVIIIIAIFILTFSFIPLIPSVFFYVYYLAFISGLVLMLIAELSNKNYYSGFLLVLIISLIIPDFIFSWNTLFFTSFFYPTSVNPLFILDIIFKTALISFFVLSLFYLFYIDLRKKMSKKSKEYIKEAIIILFFIWFVALVILLILNLF